MTENQEQQKMTFDEIMDHIEAFVVRASELSVLVKEIEMQLSVAQGSTATELQGQLELTKKMREDCLETAEQLQKELGEDLDKSMEGVEQLEKEDEIQYEKTIVQFDEVLIKIEELKDIIDKFDDQLSKQLTESQKMILLKMKLDAENGLDELYKYADNCKEKLHIHQTMQRQKIVEMAQELQVDVAFLGL